MSDNRNKVLLYRTNTKDAVASKESLQYGEVAMNYNAETPFLMFKDSEDEIRKIGVVVNELGNSEINSISQKAVTDAFNLPEDYVAVEYPEVSDVNFIQTTASTHLYDSIKQVDQNVATLVQEVLNNEIVTAAALTQHNDSAGFDTNGKYVPHTNSKVLSGASSLDQADALLDNELSAINSKLDGTYIDGDTIYIKGESVDISDLQVKTTISENYEKTTYPSEEYQQVEGNDSLDNVAKKLEENIVTLHGDMTEEIGKINQSITDLNASSLKNINVNGIEGTISNNIASVTIKGEKINISENYENVTYKNEGYESIVDGDTIEVSFNKVEKNISKLDEKIDNSVSSLTESINDLSKISLKNIKVNNVDGVVTDNVAELTINGGDVKISSDYESVSYQLINGEEMFIPVNAEDTVDASVKKLDSNISKLVDEVIDNEIVTAAALTKHNQSAGFDENAEYIVNNSANYINVATNLATADNLLDSALFEVSSDVSNLENNFNDLVNKVNQLEIKAKEGDEIHNLNVVDGAAANQEDYTNLKTAIEGGMYITVNGQTVDSHVSSDDSITLYTSKSVKGEDGINTICKVYTITSDGTITSSETSSPILVNNGGGDKYLADDGSYKEVQHKLTSEYVSVEYNEKVTSIFTPAKANQTLDEAIYVVEGNVAQLVQEVLDNEEVTAAALSQHNDSAGFDVNGKYIKNTNANYIANASTLSNADNILDSAIAELSSATNSILESINTDITNINTDITDINTNIDEIEGSLSGFQMTVNGVQSVLGSLQPNITVSGHNIPLSDNYVSVEYPETISTEFSAVTKDMTVEQSINKLDGSIAQLVQEVLDNEKVVAAALTRHNDACGFDTNANYVPYTESEIIGAATSLHDADILLSNKIGEVNTNVEDNTTSITNILAKLSELEVKAKEGDEIEVLVWGGVEQLENGDYARIKKAIEDGKTIVVCWWADTKSYIPVHACDNSAIIGDNTISMVGLGGTTTNPQLYYWVVNNDDTITFNRVEIPMNTSELPISTAYTSVVYPTMTEEIFTPVVKEMNAEQAINHLDSSIAQLVQEVLDDEKVVAAAISQLNLSAGFDENANYVQNTENAIIGNASSLNEADLMLAESIENLSNSIPEKVSELTNDKFIESVTVNGILAEGSETDEYNVSVTVNADNINLGEYGESVVYPDADSTTFVPIDSTMNVKSAIKQLDSTIAQLVQEILDNEEVVSAALTVHNTSCGLTLNGEYNLNTEANYISGATSLHDADLILDAKVGEIFTKLTEIENRLSSIEGRLSALEGTGNA